MITPDEKLIQRYKDEMLKLSRQGKSANEAAPLMAKREAAPQNRAMSMPAATPVPVAFRQLAEPENGSRATESQKTQEPPETPQTPQTPTTSGKDIGYFQAHVYAGNQALPIKNANVVLKKDGEIVAFLLTDESGQTKIIETQAPPEENTLEPNNPNKTMAYTADVSAKGFTKRTDMLVDQVGGALSLLNVDLVPEPEGVS